MRKMKTLFKIIINIFIILSIGIIFNACFDDSNDDKESENDLIYGTITYNGEANSAYYVILDDDTDETNGYVKRQIINPSVDVASVDYEIDTGDVIAGTYYLLSGYDSFVPANMDPDDSSKWEAKAWYGGTTSFPVNPPSSPNITDLSEEEYSITLIELP